MEGAVWVRELERGEGVRLFVGSGCCSGSVVAGVEECVVLLAA